jgi:peptidoglycan hydrolase-like protein with peptidoglycan-binding domain
MVQARAERLLLVAALDRHLTEEGLVVEAFLAEGSSGSQVRRLQELLVERGYFEEAKVNGNFGPRTKEAVIAYQRDRGIVESALDEGAGTVGPVTLSQLRLEERRELYDLVRARGLKVL